MKGFSGIALIALALALEAGFIFTAIAPAPADAPAGWTTTVARRARPAAQPGAEATAVPCTPEPAARHG